MHDGQDYDDEQGYGSGGDVSDITHSKIKKWFDDWEMTTEPSRQEAARDKRYYDGDQWADDEKDDLRTRGQPIIVKNRIFKKVNYLIGMEIQTRTDPTALPRTPMHEDDANAIRDALRYVADKQDFDDVSSGAWRDTLIPGYGGAVVDTELCEDDTVDITLRHVNWDRLWYDLRSTRPDFKDATYVGLFTWWHVDDAIEFYAEKKTAVKDFESVIRQAQGRGSVSDSITDDKPREAIWVQDDRVRIVECYFRKGKRWYTAHITANSFLIKPKPTDYLDEKGRDVCPLIMESAFVDQDGMRYGIVRQMISPQDEINKRTSKSLHLLSVNRLHVEEGALLDPHEAQTQYARPDGVVFYQRGALKDGRAVFEKGTELAQGQIMLLEQAKQEIDGIGPDMPQVTGQASSGREIQMRQQLGSIELKQVEDSHRRWKRRMYEQIWMRIRQFWPDERWMRVRDDSEKTGYRFAAVNRKMTRGQRFAELVQKGMPMESAAFSVLSNMSQIVLADAAQQAQAMIAQNPQQAQQVPPEQQQQILLGIIAQHPLMQEQFTSADVAQLDVDIVISESPDVSILQQEEFEQLGATMQPFISSRPDLAPQMMELLVEASQLRNKKRLLQMMREPPQVDPQQQQMQQQMQELQMAKLQGELQLLQAEIANKQAWAQERGAEAQREMADAQLKGIEAATKMDELSRVDESAAKDAAKTVSELELTQAKIDKSKAEAIAEITWAQTQGANLSNVNHE